MIRKRGLRKENTECIQSLKWNAASPLMKTCFSFSDWDDELPTELGGGGMGSGRNPFDEDDAETQVGAGRWPGSDRPYIPIDAEDTSVRRDSDSMDLDQTLLDNMPEIGLLAILWELEGYRRGKIYKIRNGDIIGKREGALLIDDPKVSTPHCRFRMDKNKFVLWDCGSKNGTFVNGKRIYSATTLEENDLIKIGDVVFVFKTME